jgi:hypothetical protein
MHIVGHDKAAARHLRKVYPRTRVLVNRLLHEVGERSKRAFVA